VYCGLPSWQGNRARTSISYTSILPPRISNNAVKSTETFDKFKEKHNFLRFDGWSLARREYKYAALSFPKCKIRGTYCFCKTDCLFCPGECHVDPASCELESINSQVCLCAYADKNPKIFNLNNMEKKIRSLPLDLADLHINEGNDSIVTQTEKNAVNDNEVTEEPLCKKCKLEI